jgi:hypothetical protein
MKGSLSRATSGVALLGAIFWLGACVEPDPEPRLDDGVTPIPDVVDLGIDGAGRVELQPGAGIGVAVEYVEGGVWSVTATCDTTLSEELCNYDVLVSTDIDAPITAFEGQSLEGEDEVFSPDPSVVQADLETGEDTDGFGFTTSPGATVRVSALLYDPGFGWSDDPRFISWVGDGGVHRGAPTNPVDLTPDRP